MILLLTIMRLVAPVLLFKRPRLTILLILFLDSLDYQLFPRQDHWYEYYARWDKLMDLYGSLALAFYIGVKWQEQTAKRIGYGLLGLRLIGVVLFELTALRFFLFLFPNVFESLIVYREFVEKSTRKVFGTIAELPTFASVLVLGMFRFIQEYFLHITQVLPWQTTVGRFFEGGDLALYANGMIWSGFFILLQVSALLLVAEVRHFLHGLGNGISKRSARLPLC